MKNLANHFSQKTAPVRNIFPTPAKKIYKVSELTREIRLLLESRYPVLWVEGEISNFKRAASGHIYFTLKDSTAQINAVLFARESRSLTFELENGLHIICIGRISVYDARGNYQLYVQHAQPKGMGALQLAFLQLKEKLEKEGLFDESRKMPIPRYPKRIGVVTSASGAAFQDILKVLKRKSYGLTVSIIPVRVQGAGSADEIARAIDQFNRAKDIDVMIVGRGGGSLEDLWAFNEEAVAQAVFRSRIPVISAVGHEIDWTICDFTADCRSHTPTAAAEQVVFYWDELRERLRESRGRLQNAMMSLSKDKKDRLQNLLSSYAFRQPLVLIHQLVQQTDGLIRQLQSHVKQIVDVKRHQFQNVCGRLHTLSPLAVLNRGYSLTFDTEGHLVRTIRDIAPGDQMMTKLKQGTIESKVLRLKPQEE